MSRLFYKLLKYKGFCQRRDGITTVEFAIVLPALLLIIFGTLELSIIFFAYSVLEGATMTGSRIGRTGYFSGEDRENYIRSEVQRLSGGILDSSRLNIEILSYRSFSDVEQPERCSNGDTCPCDGSFNDINGDGQCSTDQGISDSAGERASIVLYRVTYRWQVLTPFLGAIISDPNTPGEKSITAKETVKNERF
jgi:hypothetical protein